MSRYDLSDDQLATLLEDQPAYRARQLKEGLYHHFNEVGELTALPRALRERLEHYEELAPALEVITEQQADSGQTTKWLFRLHDGVAIETVLMHYQHHSTVCISSQAGCAMACSFCATGDAGYTRQLSVGEIVEQVVRAARAARSGGRRVDHVVFMGMGEPFANFERVWHAVERIVQDIGLGARHVTLSTVGLIPQIKLLGARPLQVNLAVSLHGANDELRDELVPINKRYPIAHLVSALEEYFETTHRRISFEWALISGINDRPQDAQELSGIARGLRAHVNLIPLNPTEGGSARGLLGSSPARVAAFRDLLIDYGVNVTVRLTRGQSIDAACGQLAGSRTVPLGSRIERRATSISAPAPTDQRTP